MTKIKFLLLLYKAFSFTDIEELARDGVRYIVYVGWLNNKYRQLFIFRQINIDEILYNTTSMYRTEVVHQSLSLDY